MPKFEQTNQKEKNVTQTRGWNSWKLEFKKVELNSGKPPYNIWFGLGVSHERRHVIVDIFDPSPPIVALFIPKALILSLQNPSKTVTSFMDDPLWVLFGSSLKKNSGS